VTLLAHEYSVPGAPVLFEPEKDQLLFTLFAGKDELLRRILHSLYTSVVPFGDRVRCGLGKP
jgi:hypothetical protein